MAIRFARLLAEFEDALVALLQNCLLVLGKIRDLPETKERKRAISCGRIAGVRVVASNPVNICVHRISCGSLN